MEWDWLNIIGIVAFASSGAVVAMEEEYDLLGVFFLGFVTSFGGGIIRNLLLGEPVATLWHQGILLSVAFATIGLIFLLPRRYLERWQRLETFLDALGMAAFTIQAALYASDKGYPLIAVIVAALLTGTGGGILRDLLAHRKPMVFQPYSPLYGVWAMVAAAVVGLGLPRDGHMLAALFVVIVALRMASVTWGWILPKRSL